MRRILPIHIAIGASLGVIAAYLIAGGASYKPLTVADPCEPRPLVVLGERGVFEGIALSALDGAACELQVTREELIAALGDTGGLAEFAEQHNVDEERVVEAIRAGLVRAVDDAELEGLLPGLLAGVARTLAENAPVTVVVELFRALPGDPSLADVLQAIDGVDLEIDELRDLGLDGLSGLAERLDGLLPDDLLGLLPEELRGLSPEDLPRLEELAPDGLPEITPEDLGRLLPDLSPSAGD